ncbi:uncharacterized protein MELLADRAFT_102197 [Melampsora larici-populina 98AG31]|uniref:Uncharacterized protein n=1 Tax=Melampsora larici-populina (strain 98AG31 / pathotype 3-4-7) TaxID=747676 RepID=F4R7I1_MELLP|nr:uncharacterized protein MELLADRAFT_102197 [Melampsora larici-populina 98AG31]EGG11322.1 hypothetical protein MELLADRAFT_102197 [Melampsora larici-populina 98AG31]
MSSAVAIDADGCTGLSSRGSYQESSSNDVRSSDGTSNEGVVVMIGIWGLHLIPSESESIKRMATNQSSEDLEAKQKPFKDEYVNDKADGTSSESDAPAKSKGKAAAVKTQNEVSSH